MLLLLLAAFIQIQQIIGVDPGKILQIHWQHDNLVHLLIFFLAGIPILQPYKTNYCASDAFVSSLPINGKNFLAPWKKSDRSNVDWYEASGYCAAHCAEMVTIQSAEEHEVFTNFTNSFYYRNVWGGAQIANDTAFAHWINGADATYQPMQPTNGEYNVDTLLNCLIFKNFMFSTIDCNSDYKIGVVCQRPVYHPPA